jgi:hypothetical protein
MNDMELSEKEKTGLKTELKNLALRILHDRIDHALAAMNAAQTAANEEDKSTVGDKHETSRAMAMIDRDIHARQLEAAQKELSFIQNIDVRLLHQKIETGSFAETNSGKYFFLSGLGPVEFKGEKIYFVSIASPVGKIMSNRVAGDECEFNRNKIMIKNIF